MNKFITFFNCVGIAALAGIAVWQWTVESSLRHRRDELNTKSEGLERKLSTTESALTTANSSLEEFRKRVEVLEADNTRLTKDLHEAEHRERLLAADVARLEKAVIAWKEAVADRDKAIVQLNDSLKEQVAGRNEAIGKFNDLVGKYNDLAKRTTEVEKLVVAARAERDKAQEQLKAALAVNES